MIHVQYNPVLPYSALVGSFFTTLEVAFQMTILKCWYGFMQIAMFWILGDILIISHGKHLHIVNNNFVKLYHSIMKSNLMLQ
jgi:hypothetical protein